MGTIHRIKQYIESKGINNKQFEHSVGFSNGSFASQLKNDKTIGVDKLENILSVYTDINIEWLLTGRGEMLKKESGVTPPTTPLAQASSLCASLPPPNNELMLQLIKDNGALREQIGGLKKEIETLNDIIKKRSYDIPIPRSLAVEPSVEYNEKK